MLTLKCNGLRYDIVKDIVIPILNITVMRIVAFFSYGIAAEANIINKKSEPLLYSLVKSNEKGMYQIEYNGEKIEMPCEACELKIEQGIIDEMKILIYDGENFSIYDKINDNYIHYFVEEYNWKNCSLVIKTQENFTKAYNGILYDFFYLYKIWGGLRVD